MNRWLLGLRVVLGLAVVGIVAAYAAIRMHEQANVVDIEVLPSTIAKRAEPTPVRPRDLPSDEVREQVEFYPGGGPGCAPPDRGGVAISVGFENRATIGTRAEICSEGFVEDKEISVRVSGHGSRIVGRWMPPGSWRWDVPPDTLPGRYRVRAIQGHRTARASMRMIISPQPFVRIRAFPRKPDFFAIVVGGAPANRQVPVHVYRAVNPTTYQRNYLSTLTVPTNEQGNGSIELRGTGGSTYTCYGVIPGFKGIALTEDQFCFGRPDLD